MDPVGVAVAERTGRLEGHFHLDRLSCFDATLGGAAAFWTAVKDMVTPLLHDQANEDGSVPTHPWVGSFEAGG